VSDELRSAPVQPNREEEESLPPSPMTMQDGIRAVQTAFSGPTPPRWPMYVRQAKQFLRNAIEGFDEKNYGFASVVDLLRAAGKEGVLRIERDRQGAIRAFAGPKLTAPAAQPVEAEQVAELPIVDAEPVVEPAVEAPVVEATPVETPAKPARRRRTAKPKAEAAASRPKRTPARARKTVRTKDAAADQQ
jgi:hypothetical protein